MTKGAPERNERPSMPSNRPQEGLKVVHMLMGLDFGGAERLIADSLPSFPKDRYRMEVVALGKDGPVRRSLEQNGIPVTVLNGSWSRPGFPLRLMNFLKSNRPDILHTHLYWPGVFGRLIGRRAGIRLIICHEHFLDGLISPLRRRLEAPTWKYADAMVAVSNGVLRSREKYLPENVMRRVIYNGLETGEIAAGDRSSARLKMGLSEDNMVVGWVGRVIDPVKDISAMLAAAASLKDKFPPLRWAIIGDGPDRKAMEEKGRRMGLKDTVKWLGAMPDARALYHGMDIFALPSRSEGLPMVLLEAMAAGLPVVASRVGGIPEIVINGETGFKIEPGGRGALAEKVLSLARDEELRKTMGIAGRKRVNDNFSMRKFTENMDRLYAELWAEKSCAGSRE